MLLKCIVNKHQCFLKHFHTIKTLKHVFYNTHKEGYVMSNLKYAFGQRIKELRKQRGLTQEKLAEKIGINLRQLARIEAGESFVTAETIENICRSLNLQLYELFNFEIQQVVLKTGTDNTNMHFKAIKSGNVIQFINNNVENNRSFQADSLFDADERIFGIVKNIKRDVIIDEFHNGILVKTKIYKTNGTIETINHIKENKDFEMLREKILKIENDKKKIEFLNLALDSLTKKSALEELKTLIKGIELIL